MLGLGSGLLTSTASYNGVPQRWLACAHPLSPSLIPSFPSVKGDSGEESTFGRDCLAATRDALKFCYYHLLNFSLPRPLCMRT